VPDIGIIDVEDAEFYLTDGGFIGLKYKNSDFNHIELRRLMPTEMPMSYISVMNHKNEEIGILRKIDELSPQQQVIVLNELNSRYYTPHILDVKSAIDKMGYLYLDMRIRNNNGIEYDKNCVVKDFQMMTHNSWLVCDMDGNRYLVQDIAALSRRSFNLYEFQK
jgi:hypothetical protein